MSENAPTGATVDSTSVTEETPVQRINAHSSAARTASARKAFAEAIAASKSSGSERVEAARPAAPAQVEPSPHESVAEVEAEPPPWFDLERARSRRYLSADIEREAQHGVHDKLEEYIYRPSTAYKAWLEDMRGEKFASEEDFKTEAADFITHLSVDILGVPLPPNVRAKFDAAQAKKMVRTSKTTQAKRDAAARERAEKQQLEAEWGRAAETLDRHFAEGSDAAKAFPWLATEDNPGQVVVDVIRAAGENGERISWEAAAKLADRHLKAQYGKRATKVNASQATAKPKPKPVPVGPEAKSSGPWSRDKHKNQTLARLRALQKGDE